MSYALTSVVEELRSLLGSLEVEKTGKSSTTITVPSVTDTRVWGDQRVLITGKLQAHEAHMLYEQFLWAKYGKGVSGEFRHTLAEKLGPAIARLVSATKVKHQGTVVLLWAISKHCGVDLVLNDRDCYVDVGTRFGVIDGKLISHYVKDVEILGCDDLLSRPVKVLVVGNELFISALAAARGDRYIVNKLIMYHTILGSTEFNAVGRTVPTKHVMRVLGNEVARGVDGLAGNVSLFNRCMRGFGNTKVHWHGELRIILVPKYLSSAVFNTLFGRVNDYRLPGMTKHRKLKFALSMLFKMKSETDDE